MNKLLTALAAVSVLAISAPAAAQQGYGNQGYGNQGYGNQGYGNGAGIEDRLQRLEMRIDAGVRAGTIDRREARTLRQQLRDIAKLERQYSRDGGLDQRERADLQQRVRHFRDRLQMADGRGYGDGNGRYGSNDGYDDGYYGQGGPYEEAYCEDNRRSSGGGLGNLGGLGGLGGIIDSIFGGNRNGNNDECRTLRVGQRASGNLGAVPYQYRTQFRDGGGVYYRSDGRTIYQIDARTDTVLRVYDMNR
jgi:type II secretory pathway pseudopilin PulG